MLSTRAAATAGLTVQAMLALSQDRDVIKDERFLAWQLCDGHGAINTALDGPGLIAAINAIVAAHGVALGEHEQPLKDLVRRKSLELARGFCNAFAHNPLAGAQALLLLQPGNALHFYKLDCAAVRARKRQPRSGSASQPRFGA